MDGVDQPRGPRHWQAVSAGHAFVHAIAHVIGHVITGVSTSDQSCGRPTFVPPAFRIPLGYPHVGERCHILHLDHLELRLEDPVVPEVAFLLLILDESLE